MEIVDGCEHIYNAMQLGHCLGPHHHAPAPRCRYLHFVDFYRGEISIWQSVDIYKVQISIKGEYEYVLKSSYLHSVDIYKVRISAQYRYLLCVDIYPAARRTGASSSELVGASLRCSAPAPLPAAALLLGSARPQHSPPRCLFIITLKSGLLCLCNTNSASQLKILGHKGWCVGVCSCSNMLSVYYHVDF